jgi:hypothetical protein
VAEMKVSGEIRTLAWREGSSGIFTGSINGIYQGYRFGSTTPDERRFTIEAPNGSIALLLRQEISTFLPPRPQEHPFANGRDPLTDAPPSGGLPPGLARGGERPGAHGPGQSPGMDRSQRPFFMKVTVRVDPDKSTGIFTGAVGETELSTPHYLMAGYLVVNTGGGDLCLNFLEHELPEEGNLVADLQVDGVRSTGIYQNARGELTFSIAVAAAAHLPNYGKGSYKGTMWLEQEPKPSG